jgi:hypothetical protein
MEIKILAGALAFLVLMVWLSKTLNRHSEMEYGYTPIGLSTIFLGMIPYVLIIAGLLFQDNDPMNLPMAMLFASLSVIGLFYWILKRSSAMVATGAVVILMIAGLPAVLFLFFSGRDDEYYYYD